MRVLQIMECTIGGTRRHLRDLVGGLLARGVDVEVAAATLRDPGMEEDLKAMAERGAGVHRIPMVRQISPARDLLHGFRLSGVVLDRRFDVVHTHSSKAGALGRISAFLCSGAARVHTPHTFASLFEGRGQGGDSVGPRGLIGTIEKILCKASQRVIHVSESERNEGAAHHIVPPSRAVVVPNGIDPLLLGDGTGDAFRETHRIPKNVALVGTVGLLNDAKAHDLLIESFSRLEGEPHLLLVGYGELEEVLRAQARDLGLTDRVHMPGWIDDVAGAYRAMDVFVLSSRWEGLAYALLEAMALGCPCISTEVNGSREALLGGEEEAGLLVPREDSTALAKAMNQLLGDEKARKAFGASAAKRIVDCYTLDAMIDGTLAVYRDVIGLPGEAE